MKSTKFPLTPQRLGMDASQAECRGFEFHHPLPQSRIDTRKPGCVAGGPVGFLGLAQAKGVRLPHCWASRSNRFASKLSVWGCWASQRGCFIYAPAIPSAGSRSPG